jgi:cysteine desulfurase/selenocysteine lyase
MSTSDLTGGAGDLDNVIDLTGSKAAAAAGLPDPAELAKLAAEFYGTLSRLGMPADTTIPSTVPSAPIPVAPAMPATVAMPAMSATPEMPVMPNTPGIPDVPGFSFMTDVRSLEAMTGDLSRWGATPSESQLRTLAATAPAVPGVQSVPWMGSLTALPGAPGMTAAAMPAEPAAMSGMPAVPATSFASVPASVPSTPVPAFDFVTNLRSVEEMSRGLGGSGVTPSESQLRSMAQAAPASTGVQSIPWMGGVAPMPGLPAIPTETIPSDAVMIDAALPHIPGAAMPYSTASGMPSFGFFDVTRPLDPAGMAPVAGSIPQDLGGFKASDITTVPFDVQAIRRDFPIFNESFNGKQLVWLDNAATTQKPNAVIDRLSFFYAHENSNVHRAAHQLAARATDAYEAARETVRRFLNASSTREIVFVRGTTEGINLIAQSWGRRNIGKDDEIVITWLEHHANIVPWQMLCQEKGAKLRVAPVDDSGQVLLDEYERLLGPRTKLVSFSHVSNALGTITPAHEMIAMAHRYGAKVVLDGAQSVAHTRVDVQEYDCDFFVFSGHKIFAPTGVGVVFGKADILEHTPPWQGGGNMIKDVTFEKTIYNDPPVRFEAGTGTIADAVGLGAALDYVQRIGIPNIAVYEHDLLTYGTEVLRRIPGLRLIGTAKEKASVLSFVIDGYRTEDIGAALAKEGIAVRAGHHCAQPILRRFGLESTVRPSLAFYNTCEEIDALAAALWNLKSGWLR